MSITVLALAKSFSNERLSADEFSNAYMEIWKFERDNNILKNDGSSLSECISSIFCLADLYNPASDRQEYELDENQLRMKVSEIIDYFNL
ncbi:colicin immunity domain-containing protein [Vibrio navarrensis]|uniref:colicin immunity domain-containing protein n=1 Tax=Vibrio navarrensis TaxID=29495 RepID=UPI001869B0B0|nr:colicin immunity domain-containing protein [Vibrio navarrensis]MBE4608850.1 colicin immunity protein [Vibrio navarrensis]MBE4612392.1 colicin immunity protein [Vibrio navarrensis]